MWETVQQFLASQGGIGVIVGIFSTFGVMYFGRDRWAKLILRADEYADAIDQVTDQLKKQVDVKVNDAKKDK